MAFTSLGIGSGIDINTMVSQLVALERKPIEQMQAAATRLQTQVSSLGKTQSLLAAVQDAANALNSATLWKRSVATSADERFVGVVGGSTAAPGNYSVGVSSLAAPQTVSSATPYALPTTLVGSGTLAIDIGSWTTGAAAFTPKAGSTTVNLTVEATDTVQTLRDKVNALNAGITATIVTDSSGTRLAFRSTASGVDNGFRIGATGSLQALAFDPPSGTIGAGGMAYSQPAANAGATINGITVATTSNELSGVVDGMTLRLRQLTTTPVDVSVVADTAAVKEAVQKFADAYNALARHIAEETKYDPNTKVGGVLQGESTITGLLGRLRGVINQTSGASSAFGRLSDLGLQLQRDGTLAVDNGKLDAALANLPELKKALSNTDALLPANDGFMRRFAALATEVLGVDGSLTTRAEGLRKQITRNGDQQQRLEDRVERYRERLVAQFSAMDANLSKLNALQSYVTQQLAAFQNSNKDD